MENPEKLEKREQVASNRKYRGRRHNQPPIAESEVNVRIAQLIKSPIKGPGRKVDRKALISEWIMSDDSVAQFARDRGLHPGSFQKWGGRTFWIQLRDAVKTKALLKTVEQAPDVWARRFESIGATVEKADDLTKRLLAEINKTLDEEQPDDKDKLSSWTARRTALEDRVRTLAETVTLITDALFKFKNDGVQKHELKSVNLHASLVDELKERDRKFGA